MRHAAPILLAAAVLFAGGIWVFAVYGFGCWIARASS